MGEEGPPWAGHAWPTKPYSIESILNTITEEEVVRKQTALAKFASRFVIQDEDRGELDAVRGMLETTFQDAQSMTVEDRVHMEFERVRPSESTDWYPQNMLNGLEPSPYELY